MQIIADEKKKDILSIAFSRGNKHDFRLFKESRLPVPEETLIIADKGVSIEVCKSSNKVNN